MFSFLHRLSEKEMSLGQLGENLGCRYLKEKGYRILETNYKNTRGYRLGEIDIIAQKDEALVFVEVKTRLIKPEETLPEENITFQKLKKLERIAAHYLRIHQLKAKPYYFDALSILFNPATKTASIKHLEHIFL